MRRGANKRLVLLGPPEHRCLHRSTANKLASEANVLNKRATASMQVRQEAVSRLFRTTVIPLSLSNVYFPVICTKCGEIEETFSSLWTAERFRGSRRPQTSSWAETFQAKMRRRVDHRIPSCGDCVCYQPLISCNYIKCKTCYFISLSFFNLSFRGAFFLNMDVLIVSEYEIWLRALCDINTFGEEHGEDFNQNENKNLCWIPNPQRDDFAWLVTACDSATPTISSAQSFNNTLTSLVCVLHCFFLTYRKYYKSDALLLRFSLRVLKKNHRMCALFLWPLFVLIP